MNDTCDSACLLEECEVLGGHQPSGICLKPGQADSFVLVEGERIAAEIVEESFGGVEVLAGRLFHREVNEPVEMVYRGLRVTGTILSIASQGMRMRLQIQWTQHRRRTVDEQRPRCRTESDYLLLAGLPVACRVMDQTDSRLTAMLPDGTQMEVAADDIHTIDRFQRLADLAGADAELRLLTAVYQLGSLQSTDDALRGVLNLEFAPFWE